MGSEPLECSAAATKYRGSVVRLRHAGQIHAKSGIPGTVTSPYGVHRACGFDPGYEVEAAAREPSGGGHRSLGADCIGPRALHAGNCVPRWHYVPGAGAVGPDGAGGPIGAAVAGAPEALLWGVRPAQPAAGGVDAGTERDGCAEAVGGS